MAMWQVTVFPDTNLVSITDDRDVMVMIVNAGKEVAEEVVSSHNEKAQGKRFLELIPAFLCDECEAISEEAGGTLYECAEDGKFNRETSFNDNHQCPECRKFSAKVAEQSCIECNAGEVREIDAFLCPQCDHLVEVE